MAESNSGFNIGTIQSLINKFFKAFGDFLDGYEVKSNKVVEKSGQVTSMMVLQPTVNGKKIDLRISLSATNPSSAFKKELECIDTLDNVVTSPTTSGKSNVATLKLLIGENALAVKKDNTLDWSNTNILLNAAINRGKNGSIKSGGALGVDLPKALANDELLKDNKYNLWYTKAFKQLKYTLICETDYHKAGKVSGQDLMSCMQWIYKYINYIGGIIPEEKAEEEQNPNAATSLEDLSDVLAAPKFEQLSHEEKQKRNTASSKSAAVLVLPILEVIQNKLREIYQEKLNTDEELDHIIHPDNTQSQNQDDQGQQSQSDDSDKDTQEIEDEITEHFGDADMAAKHISVTLKKIQASNELAILSLDSNYLPGETLSDIDEIINQDEFLNTLTEEPQAFNISVDDDGFDIEPCEECPQCDPCASLCEVFKAAIRAYRNLYIIHWMSSGNDMMKLHLLAEDMYKELIEEIDTLGELLVEKQGTVPQLDFPCDYVPVQQYDFQGSLPTIKSLLQMYLDCLDYAYPNQTSDVQSTLDEWIRYWNKQMNYFVGRQEKI